MGDSLLWWMLGKSCGDLPREWQGHLVPEEALAVRGPFGPPQQC